MKFFNLITQCSICVSNPKKKELNLEHLNKTNNEDNNIESGGIQLKDIDYKNKQIKKDSTINRIFNEELNLNINLIQNKDRISNSHINKNFQLENIVEKDNVNMTIDHAEENYLLKLQKKDKNKEENKEEHKIKKVRKHLMEDLF